MKTTNIRLLFLALLVVFSTISCKKDFEPSRITFLPDIKIIGAENFVIVSGDDFTDPGATATVNGTPIDYTVSGEVDNNTPGLYILSYEAVNSDGFKASATRNVFVLPEAVTPGAADLSGNYKRSTNGRDSKVTKVADGVYFMTDGWGSATSGGNPLPINCYLICPDGVNITMPLYPTVFGGMEGSGTFNGTQMSILTSLIDQGPFTRTNTWIKQ